MATIDPIAPQSGWKTRWIRQALGLCWRGAEALTVLSLGALAIGGLTMAADSLLVGLLGQRNAVLDDVVELATAVLGVPAALATTALLCKADMGNRVDWAQIRTLSPRGMAGVALYVVFVSLTSGLMGRYFLPYTDTHLADTLLTPWLDAQSHPLLVALTAGLRALYYAVPFQMFYGPSAFALMIGMGAGWEENRRFRMRLRAVAPGPYQGLYTAIVLVMVAFHAMGPLMLAATFFYLAWQYVAVRELVGGPRENAPQKTTASTPVPQTA